MLTMSLVILLENSAGGGRSGSCFEVLPIFQITFSKPMFSKENEKQTNKKQNKNKSISNFLAYHTSDSKG